MLPEITLVQFAAVDQSTLLHYITSSLIICFQTKQK